MKDLLKFEDFQKWIQQQEITYASRTISGKHRLTLNVTTNGGYIVRVGPTIYWQGMQPFIAVEKFNELV